MCLMCLFSNFIKKFYEHLDLLSYGTMILNMIWHVLQKVVKCYFLPLPWLSYIYWAIYFNVSPRGRGLSHADGFHLLVWWIIISYKESMKESNF